MKWVTMWGNAQSTVLPAPATYAKNLTLRYPVLIPFNGNRIRINLDNYCCDEDVTITSCSIGVADSFSDKVLEHIPVTFDGKSEAYMAKHGSIVSDPIDIELTDGKYLVVSLYMADYTNLTSGVDITGPLSKGYFAYGNQLNNDSLDINTSKSTSWVYFLANIDIYTDDNNEAVICYGDSITSQAWPDYMLLALRENNVKNISVVRKAVSGTRVLRQYSCITYQSYGLCGENRFKHEISSVSGATKLIIQHGINDIIHPVGTEVNVFRPMSDLPTSDELIAGIKYYIANSTNLEVFVGNLLPIYGWRTYAQFREDLKNEFNSWVKSLPNCIDFENEIGELVDGAYHFKDNCDSKDHLHPSNYAYELMGKLAAKRILEKTLSK